MRYAVAYGVKGFRRSGRKTTFVRVCVERTDDRYAWVRTADLADAGTPLVLDLAQIEYEHEWVD